MKKTIIGGFLFLGGVIGITPILMTTATNSIDSWVTPPGRCISTILDNGLWFPAIIFLITLTLGAVILGREYKK
ncbi:peptidase M50 [Pygmaiobacter massiliensis]|uniref:peptidase M50 n=1 Tax=Pygmaiobacter massiliensis TaxID=1917873 RepID=UPI002A8261E6|nr:peptidase M50 [Pygmaiobacter massiliensis]MDY4785570.1 peptidase M50 [Pygmaiobacter massiliensis]